MSAAALSLLHPHVRQRHCLLTQVLCGRGVCAHLIDMVWLFAHHLVFNDKSLRVAITSYFADDETVSVEENLRIRYLFGPIEEWQTQQVTNTTNLFAFRPFNCNIEWWDVGQVRDAAIMFQECRTFNQPLERWNTANFRDCEGMFGGCVLFNQPLNGWNVKSIEISTNMFRNCAQFNQPLDQWNTRSLRNARRMFEECCVFNQSLNTWDVSEVRCFDSMFKHCVRFNQPLDRWNVYNAQSLCAMFANAHAFNQPLSSWKLHPRVEVNDMFWSAHSFNQDTSFLAPALAFNCHAGARCLAMTTSLTTVPTWPHLVSRATRGIGHNHIIPHSQTILIPHSQSIPYRLRLICEDSALLNNQVRMQTRHVHLHNDMFMSTVGVYHIFSIRPTPNGEDEEEQEETTTDGSGEEGTRV